MKFSSFFAFIDRKIEAIEELLKVALKRDFEKGQDFSNLRKEVLGWDDALIQKLFFTNILRIISL